MSKVPLSVLFEVVEQWNADADQTTRFNLDALRHYSSQAIDDAKRKLALSLNSADEKTGRFEQYLQAPPPPPF